MPTLTEHELPQEVLDEMEVLSPKKIDFLAQLTNVLIKKREEAILFRRNEGLEEVWTLCEEQYNGIDDANRHEFKDMKWVKPMVMNAPVTTSAIPRGVEDPRSSAFVRITSRYVDVAAAKVGEILLPIDDKAFAFDPTPVPDLVKMNSDLRQVVANGQPLMRNARPEELPPTVPAGDQALQPVSPAQPAIPGQPAKPPGVPLTYKDLAEEQMLIAVKQAKKAELRIYDWMVESQYPRETRKVIFDSARLGVGVLKGPYPDKRRSMAIVKKEDEKNGVVSVEGGQVSMKLEIHEEIVPVASWRDVWNIFPDPACGENINDGDYVFERDFVSPKQVRKLKGLPGYIDSQLDQVLTEGPGVKVPDTRDPQQANDHKRKHQFEIWYYTGTILREELEALNQKAAKGLDNNKHDVHAVVTMINDVVVKATLNPLDSGELNYHNIPWQRRPGCWAGVGIPEQLRVPQRIVNAATRAMLNNAGLAAGAQIVMDQTGIKPADGRWVITPNKIWYKSADGAMDDVNKAFALFPIPMVQRELMEIIQYGLRLAEEVTSIPLITQGMTGPTTPETLGATQLQNNNAMQLLRSIGYAFDDHITEPLVRLYYEWLLLDPDVPDDEKGDFQINAHGSVAMVERALQDQTIAQMIPLAQNPIFGVDPKKWFAVLAKSKHLDPAMFQYSPIEQARLDAAPKPLPPAVQVAQIKAQQAEKDRQVDQQARQQEAQLEQQLATLEHQTEQAIAKLKQETSVAVAQLGRTRDLANVKVQAERAQAEFQQRIEELKLKRELAIMEYANSQSMNADTIKGKLADKAMSLKVQKELAAAEMALETHQLSVKGLRPPVQTPGKAGNGKAFTQQ